MKRVTAFFRRRDVVFVVLVSLLPFVFIFTSPLLPHTSDGGVHLPRMGAYFKALADGHFPVRWAGDLNYGYGLPLFNFIYQAPYLISSIFIFFGLGLVSSFKITLALSFIFSGIFMYVFVREWLGDPRRALFVTLFYQFAPFRMVEILVRGAIGGIYAYTFFPLVLYGLAKIAKKPSAPAFALTAIASMLLVISHNSLSLLFFGVASFFAIFFVKGKKQLIMAFGGLMYGLLLSAFFWLPAIAEHKYTYGNLFMKDLYTMYFPPLINFFVPNVTDNPAFRTGEVSTQLGLFHIIAILLAIIGLVGGRFDKKTKPILLFGLALTAGAIFFMQPVSLLFWERISFLRQFQFPWRFLAVTSFSTALLSLSFEKFVHINTKNVFRIILFFVIATTAYYWYPRQGFDRVKETDFWNYPLNTTYFGETDVIWSAGPAKAFPSSRVEFIEGSGTVVDFQKRTQIHTFRVDAASQAKLVDHTQYFPGWRVYVDNQKTPIEFQDQLYRGEITFALPQGTHDVRVVFEESKIRLVADVVSFVSAGLLAIGFVWKHFRRRKT